MVREHFCPAIVAGIGATAIVYFLASFVFVLIAKTSLSPQTPIEILYNVPVSIRKANHIDVDYEKMTVVKQNVTVKIIRTLIHKSGATFQLPEEIRVYSRDDMVNRVRPMELPWDIPNGQYVLDTYVVFTPPFSMMEKTVKLPQVKFNVCPVVNKPCI
jgi:hypothetical protein